MTAENATPQKMVSTPTLIVLVVGLVLLGYMLLQPMFAPEQTPPVAQSATPVSNAAAPVADQPVVASDSAITEPLPDLIDPPLLPVDSGERSGRDPFWPAVIATRNSEPQPQPQPQPELLPVPVIPELPTVADSPVVSKAAVSTESGLVWKGIVGMETDQLVLIQRNNRTYTLRLGDLLPGTKYILAEVNHDSVLLLSPADQKRLYKKKEAKING